MDSHSRGQRAQGRRIASGSSTLLIEDEVMGSLCGRETYDGTLDDVLDFAELDRAAKWWRHWDNPYDGKGSGGTGKSRDRVADA